MERHKLGIRNSSFVLTLQFNVEKDCDTGKLHVEG